MKRLDEIFNIWYGVNLELMRCEEQIGGIPFVSRTSVNNGIVGYVKELEDIKSNPSHTISVACSGSVLSTFYQPLEYYSGRDVYILKPINALSVVEMLYYCAVIEKNKYRYNYGRAANKTLKNILVPDINELPDYVNKTLISDYEFEKQPVLNKKIELKTKDWKWFEIGEIFNVDTGKDLLYFALEEGEYPVIGHKATNNGVTCTSIKLDDYLLYDNNKTISLADRGNFYATVQIQPFYIGTRVKALRAKFESNIYILLFICVLINNEQYRFSYGRNCCSSTESLKIKLPVNKKNNPDFEFMENYIKSLPYSSSI